MQITLAKVTRLSNLISLKGVLNLVFTNLNFVLMFFTKKGKKIYHILLGFYKKRLFSMGF